MGDLFKVLLGIGALVAAAFTVKVLIDITIELINVTIESIKKALQNRSDITSNNVISAIVTDFIKGDNCTIVTLDALNASNKKVGNIKVSGSLINVKKGDKIVLA